MACLSVLHMAGGEGNVRREVGLPGVENRLGNEKKKTGHTCGRMLFSVGSRGRAGLLLFISFFFLVGKKFAKREEKTKESKKYISAKQEE